VIAGTGVATIDATTCPGGRRSHRVPSTRFAALRAHLVISLRLSATPINARGPCFTPTDIPLTSKIIPAHGRKKITWENELVPRTGAVSVSNLSRRSPSMPINRVSLYEDTNFSFFV